MSLLKVGWVPVAIVAAALTAAPASADERAPILMMTDTPTDPAKFAWLNDGARAALGDAIAQYKAGSLFAFVFAGGPGGDFWAYRSAASDTVPFSIDDLARQALQSCEFVRRAPCLIVSVNGNDARDSGGGLPVQPSLLADQPEEFDPGRVPFVGMTDQGLLAAYPAEPKAKVFVITVNAGWLWRTGNNIFEAAAKGLTDCQTTYPGQLCILYAVNSRVVFEAGGPF